MSFKSLVSVVSEQCQEIKQALTLFPYFETWEPDLIAECCRVSSVVEFPPDEVILGLDTGNSHAVYFILEGVCKMLQNLYVFVKKGSRQKAVYKRHKFSDSKAVHSESKSEVYVSRLFNQNHTFQKQAQSENGTSREKADNCGIPKRFANEEMKSAEENLAESNHRTLPFHAEVINNQTNINDNARAGISNESNGASGIFKSEEASKDVSGKKLDSETEPSQQSKPLIQLEREKIQVAETSEPKEEPAYEFDIPAKVLAECKKRRENTIRILKKTPPIEKPKNTKCFFVQTGLLWRGACFGLDVSETENFILSVTKVKCLKIPRRFLLQHNPCNIWNRIRLFHSLYLPKEEKIFEYFQLDRMWEERKKAQTAEVISLKNLPRYTSLSEVPYTIRLAELLRLF